MNWYVGVLKNYFGFSGRAHRQEYWMFVLFNFLIMVGLGIIENILGLPGVVSGLYSLAVFIPSLAVGFRRIHDIGKSAWWLLIGLVPVIGIIVLIIFFVLPSQPQSNQYGPVPA
ncbi:MULTISPECIES: DUF805 domain-containing protein [Desulfatibacillum]|jgi:uncharacterized membrane protein YhaH (DUF805 family)|uniref:DUF805 domain-containing protein n=2 Tax=Desulfatibacillum TaxID=218207 RepID=B8FHT6_DESAL|nr:MULTISPECIES: DUF805 domain-containing protein [Desulfatibacillum]ACL02503.1 protein of unknown function DUF805 [Desulfatibacillum aliphaticivorans]SHK84759.1 Uncharacterized membrane protein YhaH, DUF805 family [Desulfatibacillum alkenivorans DSM 16219]